MKVRRSPRRLAKNSSPHREPLMALIEGNPWKIMRIEDKQDITQDRMKADLEGGSDRKAGPGRAGGLSKKASPLVAAAVVRLLLLLHAEHQEGPSAEGPALLVGRQEQRSRTKRSGDCSPGLSRPQQHWGHKQQLQGSSQQGWSHKLDVFATFLSVEGLTQQGTNPRPGF